MRKVAQGFSYLPAILAGKLAGFGDEKVAMAKSGQGRNAGNRSARQLLLDLSDRRSRLDQKTRKRGMRMKRSTTSTFEEQVDSDQIEDVLAMFSEMGINVVDNEENESERSRPAAIRGEEAGGDLVEATTPCRPPRPPGTDRTDDPGAHIWAQWNYCRAKAKSPSQSGTASRAMIASCRKPLTFSHHHLARRTQ